MSVDPIDAVSKDINAPALSGTQQGNGGTGVLGIGPANGVTGKSTGSGFSGVFGHSESGPGVFGTSNSSVGVDATTETGPAAMRAVHHGNGPGIIGVCQGSGNSGVFGHSESGPGISGTSTSSVGVDAVTQTGPAAIRAVHHGDGPGVIGVCQGSGNSGVFGQSNSGPGVSGISSTSVGVDAKTQSGPAALRAIHEGGGLAGDFGGNVHVSNFLFVDGDIQLTGADLAEQFGFAGSIAAEPGSVVVLAGNDLVGVSERSYDCRVAGIVSGAGNYRPGIVLDRQPDPHRCTLALTGKVWCKVDAAYGAIEVGDMLTTSPTPGHAMRVTDPRRAYGAVVGKSLGTLQHGRGLVPVLVALQ